MKNETQGTQHADTEYGPGAEYPIDRDHLSGFTHHNRTLERKILALFARHSLVDFQALSDSTTIEDWRKAAHTLKNSACSVGAWQIVRAAGAAENMQGDLSSPQRDALLTSLGRSVHDAGTYIESILEAE